MGFSQNSVIRKKQILPPPTAHVPSPPNGAPAPRARAAPTGQERNEVEVGGSPVAIRLECFTSGDREVRKRPLSYLRTPADRRSAVEQRPIQELRTLAASEVSRASSARARDCRRGAKVQKMSRR